MKEKKHIPTSGGPITWTSPFAALKNAALPLTPEMQPGAPPCNVPAIAPKKNRGRVDIIRQTAHRGGKTVTVVTGFTGIGQAEKETLAKEMQKACGAGGTGRGRADRNSGRPARSSRLHPDHRWFSAGVCWRVRVRAFGLREALPSIDFLPCSRYRLHHYVGLGRLYALSLTERPLL